MGESIIRGLLEQYQVKFISQHSFDDCVNVSKLRFDFYLPEYNTAIEYDGEGHFRPLDYAGNGDEWAQRNFETTQKSDSIKNAYCNTHNIDLIRIPYWERSRLGSLIPDILIDLQQNHIHP